MIVLPFDSETNGIPEWKLPSEDPIQPHIVSLNAILFDDEKGEVIEELDCIVKPDGWEWDDSCKAFQTHGITVERAMDEGIDEREALIMFLDLHGRCDRRVAFNTTFDNRIIRIAISRYMGKGPANHFKAHPYFCTMLHAKKFAKLGKNPKLAEAYQHILGRELENAHNAKADNQANLDLYLALKDHFS